MPDLILHYALTKALKNNDKENNKNINYMNQLRENHWTKIVTEMLLVMLLNDLSVKLVVTEPQKGCGLSSLNLVFS